MQLKVVSTFFLNNDKRVSIEEIQYLKLNVCTYFCYNVRVAVLVVCCLEYNIMLIL